MLEEQIVDDAPAIEEPVQVRYDAYPVEARRIGGRDVEFRTVEVGNLELRSVDGEDDDDAAMPMRFSGYAAVFDSPSEPLPFIETIAPGAFTRSLQSGRETRMFLNHNTDQVLASTKSGTLTLTEDSRGLFVEAELPDTSYGRDLSVLIQRGDVHSMSFGFSVPSGGESRSADGQSRRLNQLILHETSVITGFPAYQATEGVQVRTTEELPAESADEPVTGRSVALAQRYLALNAKR